MLKRLLKNVRYFRFIDNFPEFKLGSILIMLLCTFLIIIATFTQLELNCLVIPQEAYIHPTDFFVNNNLMGGFFEKYYYIPQIPAVLFTSALLGPAMGIIATILYVIAGMLGFPIFASGGGINYYQEPGFGYIIGYAAGAYLTGAVLSQKVTNMSLIRATIVGVLAIHLFGIIYMSSLLLLQHNSILVIASWIWAKSGIQLPFDLIISFVAISFARPVRSVLWMAMD
jgi:biotin transport system substrate-specific component